MKLPKYLKNLYQDLIKNDRFIDEDQTDILQTCLFYLRIMHMWPKKGRSTLMGSDLLFVGLLLFPFHTMTCFGEIVDIFMNDRNYLLDDILTNVSLVGTAVAAYSMMGVFLTHNRDLQGLVRELGDFRRFRKPRDFDLVNRRLDAMAHFLCVYVFGTILVYAVFGLVERDTCLAENEELDLHRICGMIAPPLLPAACNSGVPFLLALINEIYTAFMACFSATLMILVLIGSTEMIIVRIRDFKRVVCNAFVGELGSDERKRYLVHCVQYHCYLIDLTDNLNACLETLSFIFSSFTSIAIALIAFQFMMKPELKSFLHCSAWVFALMIVSASGQRLIDESSEISTAMYSTDWFEDNVEVQKFVQMIILRANKHLYVSTYFNQLSMEIFSGAMSNAYSLLTLLAKYKT